MTSLCGISNTPYVQSRPLESIFDHPHIIGLPCQVAKIPDPWLWSRSPGGNIQIWCFLRLTVIQLQSAGEPKKEARNLPSSTHALQKGFPFTFLSHPTCRFVSESNDLSCLCVDHISIGSGTNFPIALATRLCTCMEHQRLQFIIYVTKTWAQPIVVCKLP